MVRAFKGAVTLRINQLRGTPRQTVWQRNYYEHVIRNQIALESIRRYIVNNPAKWYKNGGPSIRTACLPNGDRMNHTG